MKKLLIVIAGVLLMTACQESLEERCAREAGIFEEELSCPNCQGCDYRQYEFR